MENTFHLDRSSALHWLILLTVVLLCLTGVLIALIFFFQLLKKNSFFRNQQIEDELDNWLAEVLLDEGEDLPSLPAKLSAYFENPANHTYITQKLITIRKNISGSGLHKIKEIYEKTGLKESSLKNFESLLWSKKTIAIYELYMMDQQHMSTEISKHTNSSNEYLRMEAQIASISFEGMKGLQFLSTLTNPLTEWQQLKLTEQLNSIPAETINGLETWLGSANPYVVHFALKITANYQQLHVHEDVVQCLGHASDKIRTEAINTLARIANPATPGILVQQYQLESEANKRAILAALLLVAGDEEQDFLLQELDQPDDDFKLLAAAVLINNTSNGDALLRQKAMEEPEPYHQIFLHVKRGTLN